jgi:predicted metal-binding protein
MALAPRGWFQVPDEQARQSRPQLHICVSCWRGGIAKSDDATQTDGRRLYETVSALIAGMGTEAPAQVLPILCFANCERGCSAGISAAGKWSYLMGDLGPEHAADLLAYAETYAKAKTGVVLPSKRPPSLEKTVIARFPASLDEFKDAAE